MWDFILGFAFACIFMPIVFGIIYVSTKSYKAKDTAFMRYHRVNDLWLKTGSTGTLTFPYSDRLVSVVVKSNYLRGTNNDVDVYQVYINDVFCATCVNMWDGENSHYGFYIDKEFDDKEVWDILDTAYIRAQEENKKDEQKKEQSSKKSVLKEANNESIRTI